MTFLEVVSIGRFLFFIFRICGCRLLTLLAVIIDDSINNIIQMVAYKIFYQDMRDLSSFTNIVFEEGKTYESDKYGYECWENALDCLLSTNTPTEYLYHEVYVEEININKKSKIGKIYACKIKIGREIGIDQILCIANSSNKVCVKFQDQSISFRNFKESVSYIEGIMSIAAVAGKNSIAISDGYDGNAVALSGDSCAVTLDRKSVAVAHHDFSMALCKKSLSIALTCAPYCWARTCESNGIAISSGEYSLSTASGDISIAIATGTGSFAEVETEGSMAVCLGIGGVAKGVVGSWIILSEFDDECNFKKIESFKVDGDKIKADRWYGLDRGRLVLMDKSYGPVVCMNKIESPDWIPEKV